MRIHITGNAGSGKSTFAKDIGDILGLHVYGLDKIVWKEGWGETPPHERKSLEEEIAAKPQWIIEGVSSIARQAADITIFLDFPRSVCYLRCIKRNWRYLFSSRPGLPNNCPEIKIIPTLAKIIWQFPYLAKPIIINEMDMKNKRIITISSNDEMSQFISKLRHNNTIMSYGRHVETRVSIDFIGGVLLSFIAIAITYFIKNLYIVNTFVDVIYWVTSLSMIVTIFLWRLTISQIKKLNDSYNDPYMDFIHKHVNDTLAK